MNAYTAVAAINVALIALIGIACWVTGSALPLFALAFLMETETKRLRSCGSDKKEGEKPST